jgi:hypothetical protein
MSYVFSKRKKVDWREDKAYRQAYFKEYYQKHRETLLNKAQERAQEKPEEIRQYLKTYVRRTDELSVKKQMLRAAKTRAKKQGVPFDLALDDFSIPEVCPVLGIVLKRGQARQNRYSPSLDKFIPSKGYVKGNVFVVSQRANMLKWDATVEEIEALARYMRRITQEQGQYLPVRAQCLNFSRGHLKFSLIDSNAEMPTRRKTTSHRERLSERTPRRRCNSLISTRISNRRS